MNILRTAAAAATVALMAAGQIAASGPVGLYGIVERVVFEPDAASPERVQLWGVFAYADGLAAPDSGASGMSPAERGYLYFRLPATASGVAGAPDVDLVRREWADLVAVAGTGQAVAFGRWRYPGSFAELHPGRSDGAPRVRPAAEAPADPAVYQTNAGIVTLSERGSHAAIVARLRAKLGAKSAE